jgi:class 3 adenylate cyclase
LEGNGTSGLSKFTPSLADVQRKIWASAAILSLLGAFIVYLYFSVIDPLPQGSDSIQTITPVGLIIFLAVLVITFFAGAVWRQRSNRRIAHWYSFLAKGEPAKDIPVEVRREVLHFPLMTTVRTMTMWLLAGLFFGLYNGSFGTFLGIAVIGGSLTTILTYLVVETLWRPVIPVFFQDGGLDAVRAFRLPVLGRLVVVILLVGILPPVVLVNLTWQRARSLTAAQNPQAILENLFVLEIYILAASILSGIALGVFVTRSVTRPLKTIQSAMTRVEQNDFDTSVAVTSNDELGYLSERFNHMVAGLRQGELLRRLFGLYVSPEVAQAAVETGAGLGGELVTSTILFSDLRDFTSISERMPPDSLIDLINRYMAVMVDSITRHGGIVTRFGGDSIMAVFGSPLNPSSRHAAQAVQAALDMRRALQAFNQEQAALREPILRMGIGIATGQVVAGNVGGKDRIEYTLMGDATNLASRLQDKTKELGSEILLSEETYRLASQVIPLKIRDLPGIGIRGKLRQLTVYILEDG